MLHDKFHGRHAAQGRLCAWTECDKAGEFRAPGVLKPGFDGPGDYRWFCLEHVRTFNAGYDYFDGMTSEQIAEAQSPVHGWETESRAFSAMAGIDTAPRWADYADPLEAISARAKARMPARRSDGQTISAAERRALGVLGLGHDADRRALRQGYSSLVRQYHPDRNGGDRSFEKQLQAVVDAYKLLKQSPIFSR